MLKSKSKKPRTHRERRKKFLAAWVRSPLSVGAIIPSSKGLARAMAQYVSKDGDGAVIELGAGTGVVTHALMQRGIDPKRMIVVEREEALFEMLHTQFKDLCVVQADARYLEKLLEQLKITKVDAVVSSLPLLSMPKTIREAIETQMARVVGDSGIIVQFTYGPRSPLNRNRLRKFHLTGKRMKTILANVPPAHVWLYRPIN